MSNARIDAELQITGPIDPPLGFDTEDQTAWRLQYLESLQYGLIDDLERMVKIARRPRFIWLNSHWSRQLQEQKQLAEMKIRDFFEVAAKRVT